MVNAVNSNNNNRNYAIGAGAGLVAGGAAGYLTRYSGVGKEVANKWGEAVGNYDLALTSHLETALTPEQGDKFVSMMSDPDLVDKKTMDEIANKFKNIGSDDDKKAFKAIEQTYSKMKSIIAGALGKEENKELNEAVQKATKEFNEGAGKDLYAKAQEAVGAVKSSKTKWIAGIAAAGAAIGALGAFVYNRYAAPKAEVPQDVPAEEVAAAQEPAVEEGQKAE